MVVHELRVLAFGFPSVTGPGAHWNPDVTAWEAHDTEGRLSSCIPAAPRLYPCSTDWPETQDA